MTGLFDPGLQPERTSLAWRRTGLALFAGSLVAARVLPEVLGAWAAVLGFTGVAAGGLLLYAAHRRYSRHRAKLLADGDRSAIADGRLIAATSLFVLSSAALSLIVAIYLAG